MAVAFQGRIIGECIALRQARLGFDDPHCRGDHFRRPQLSWVREAVPGGVVGRSSKYPAARYKEGSPSSTQGPSPEMWPATCRGSMPATLSGFVHFLACPFRSPLLRWWLATDFSGRLLRWSG
jgi:hypothetical protein